MGLDQIGLLTSATVNEAERKAYCALTLQTGEAIIGAWPLTDVEMTAYKGNPETFFGEVNRNRKADTPPELYDFFMETYSKTPKDKLLEFMAGSPSLDQIKSLPQEDLARIYVEGMVNQVMAMNAEAAKPAPSAVS